jgi:putative DNA modification/repair radical SAM protein
MDITEKLAVLADAAKYDASCASSGSNRKPEKGPGLGSTEGMGICHSYAPDGRCISLLKILLTNFCIFDCLYCVNRRSSNVRRARFSVDEVVRLTVDFYKRNYIEGLFLSSGIIRDPDYTMEQLVRVARQLRTEHNFRGYIHLKTIPDAAPELIEEAGRLADRISINVELPTEAGLNALAPEKDRREIRRAMAATRLKIDEAADDAGPGAERQPRPFAPAGQSTQMIVGADGASDAAILTSIAELYSAYRLKRVYYSAFSPIPDSAAALPLASPPMLREHRLYQADWLYRFYGFDVDEILSAAPGGMLDLTVDPKLAWALRHRERFPVDINSGPREMLLRVPGLGARTVKRILTMRRQGRIAVADLARLGVSVRKVAPFLAGGGSDVHSRSQGTALLDRLDLKQILQPQQLPLFA